MIGKLSGRIDARGLDHVLLDVQGVGYLVYVSERTLAALPGPGGFAALYTDLLVREDLLQLFGFPSMAEKEWHRLLTSVQGVGAKASMAILSALGPDGVSRAIALGDWNSIKAAKGVGPKLAQRVVQELKDKAHSVMAMDSAPASVVEPAAAPSVETQPAARATPAPAAAPPARAEALSALGNLGYAPGEAAGAVAQALDDAPEADTAALIRAALRLLAPKG